MKNAVHSSPRAFQRFGSVMQRRRSPSRYLDSARRRAFELRLLDGVGAELDRALVRARGARGVAGAAQQVGVRGVQRLVALERGIAEQRLEQLQPGVRPGREADGDGAVELDDRRGVQDGERAVELGDLRPVGGVASGAWICSAVIAACSWYSPGRRSRTARSSLASPARIRS